MDYVSKAKTALRASQNGPQGTPAFRRAVSAIQSGEPEQSANELQELDDPSLLLATMHLERLSVRLGHDVRPFAERLLTQVPKGAVDRGWISRRYQTAWSNETAGHVSAERTSSVGGRGGFSDFALVNSIEALVDSGDAAEATKLLEQFSTYDKRSRGYAMARVGTAKSDAKLMKEAVKAAALSPMIEEGGEEAEALGAVLGVFASHGVDASHDAVAACIRALQKLGKKRARKDARSYGVVDGARAAAKRGGEWTEHARTWSIGRPFLLSSRARSNGSRRDLRYLVSPSIS